MADIARRGDLDVRVVNPTTQTGLAVTSNGDSPSDLVRVGGTAITLGQKIMTASVPVAFSSDQSALPVTIAAIPSIPEGATAVNIEDFSDVASTSGVNTFHVITNGKTLTIQAFYGGSEEKTGGAVCELFYDPDANLTGMTRIRTIWVNGNSFNVGVQQEFVGNGTRRIVARRRGYSNSSREMEVAFAGYEETT